MKDILTIERPQNPLPLIFDSPHSGDIYPQDFDYACPFEELERAEDKFVDNLFERAPEFGGTFLKAHFPRSYIDVNRAIDDIDPNLLAEDWPFDSLNPSARSDAGIGLIRRLVKPGMPVYDRDLSAEEIVHRIERYYKPYHNALEKLLDEAHYNFGQAWHINCHSMPLVSAYPKQAVGLIGNKSMPSDFVIGDRDGTTCDLRFIRALRDFIRSMGYSVTTNDPFKGVEIIARHSNPPRGRYSLQIEINKSLYMDEETSQKNDGYKKLKTDIEKIIKFCADYVEAHLTELAAD